MNQTLTAIQHELDQMALAQRLAGAIRFPTISYMDYTRTDAAAFRRLHAYLEQQFPLTYRTLKKETVGDFSLLFEWEGSDPRRQPVLLTGHLDVVPVAEGTRGAWSYPPFDGCIEEGFVWGRGTLDDKVTVMGILEAIEALLQRGFRPNRSLYLAFGEDEEILGHHGAPQLAALLKSRGVQPEFVLDEGMLVTDGVIPNISKPAALIGITEKGYVGMELTVEKIGGHLAMPPKETAIGILSAAVSRLENHPVPARIDSPIFQTLDALAPEMPIGIRALLKARRLIGPLLFKVLSGTESTNATIRTTTSVTVFQAGELVNVLPASAKADVIFFLLPGDTVTGTANYARKVIADSRVQITVMTENCAEASPVSPTDSLGYRLIAASIRKAFPGVLVAPGLGTAPTDCHRYVGLTENCYRFTPIWAKPEDLLRVHGVNERISLENYVQAVEFFLDLIQTSCGERIP